MSPASPRSTFSPISAGRKSAARTWEFPSLDAGGRQTGIAAAIKSFPLILNDILASFLISCFCFARFRHPIDEPDHLHKWLGNAPVPRSRSGLGLRHVSHNAALVGALGRSHLQAR